MKSSRGTLQSRICTVEQLVSPLSPQWVEGRKERMASWLCVTSQGLSCSQASRLPGDEQSPRRGWPMLLHDVLRGCQRPPETAASSQPRALLCSQSPATGSSGDPRLQSHPTQLPSRKQRKKAGERQGQLLSCSFPGFQGSDAQAALNWQ